MLLSVVNVKQHYAKKNKTKKSRCTRSNVAGDKQTEGAQVKLKIMQESNFLNIKREYARRAKALEHPGFLLWIWDGVS